MSRIKYSWRVLVKLFMFFLFGTGSLVLIFMIFPVVRLFSRNNLSFKRKGRKIMYFTQKLFVSVGTVLGGFVLEISDEDKKILKNLHSKIIVANHPSLLDVVFILSLVPDADCIIKASLGKKNILRGIVNALYILNSLDFNTLSEVCSTSLHQGNCLIVFPEGTRTKADEKIILKKGAARIALSSGCDMIPVYIGGTDKAGLRKNDHLISYNKINKYVYALKVLSEVRISDYQKYPEPVAVRNMTDDIKFMFEREQKQDIIRIKEKESILFDKGD